MEQSLLVTLVPLRVDSALITQRPTLLGGLAEVVLAAHIQFNSLNFAINDCKFVSAGVRFVHRDQFGLKRNIPQQKVVPTLSRRWRRIGR